MRIVGILSGLGLLAAVAAGCTEYKAAPLSAATSAASLEGRTFDDPRLRRFVAAGLGRAEAADAPPDWGLSELSLAAIYYHPDLDVAQARLAQARAKVVTAAQPPNPTLNFATVAQTAATAGALPSGAVPATIGPVIDFVIETASKREHRTAEARELAEAARWDLASAAWQVRGGVRSALLQLWATRRRIALTRERLKTEDELAGLLERRLAAGQASGLDVARERVARSQIALALRGLELAADEAETALAAAVGVPVAALKAITLSFAAFDQVRAPPGEARALRREALQGRTDIQSALAQYEAAQAALRRAVAGQYPNLTLGAGYVYDAGVNKFSLSPALELPIFHRHQGEIAEAAARRQQAAAGFTALQAKVIAAIDRAAAAQAATKREAATADTLLADSRRREQAVAAAFRAGQIDRPTLLAAELETATVRLSRFDAVVAEQQAFGALEDALQHPLFAPSAVFSTPEVSPRQLGEPAS